MLFELFVFKKKIVSFVFKYFIRVQKKAFLSCSNDVVMMFIAWNSIERHGRYRNV